MATARQKQIPCGNDKQKEQTKGRDNSNSKVAADYDWGSEKR
jgi:hypothetical protein